MYSKKNIQNIFAEKKGYVWNIYDMNSTDKTSVSLVLMKLCYIAYISIKIIT